MLKTNQNLKEKTMSKMTALVALATLNMKAGTQFRAKLNEEAIADYTARYKEWKLAHTAEGEKEPSATMDKWAKCPLPPITVFESKEDGQINADGFQRIKAAKAAGLTHLPADIREGGKDEAIKFALAANADHGVRLTSEDLKNKLAVALKREDMVNLSNNALAKKIGASEFFVRSNRPADKTPKEVEATKGGKKIKVKTGRIGKKGGKAKAAKKGKGKKGEEAPVPPGPDASDEEKAAFAEMTQAEDDKGFNEETEAALKKIIKAVAEITDAEKLEKAIRDGTIEISAKNIRDLSESSLARIALAYPLVFGEKRMSPKAAYAFLDKVPDSDMKLGHLFNLTVCRGNGIVHEKVEGFHVLVIPVKGHAFKANLQLGSFFAAPNDTAAKAIEALAEA